MKGNYFKFKDHIPPPGTPCVVFREILIKIHRMLVFGDANIKFRHSIKPS